MWAWIRKLGFRSTEERVRDLEALADRGAEALPELIRALNEGGAACRLAAVRAIERIGDPAAVPCLCDCLQDPIPAVRDAALRTLGEIGTVEAAPFLCRSVLHRQPGASEALWKVLFRHYPAASRSAAAYLRKAELGGPCLMPGEYHRRARPCLDFAELRRVLDLFPASTADCPIPAEGPAADLPVPASPPAPAPRWLPRAV